MQKWMIKYHLQKRIDITNYQVLPIKLYIYSMKGKSLNWFDIYLSERKSIQTDK